MGKAPWLQGSSPGWILQDPTWVALPSGCCARLHRKFQPCNHRVRLLDPRLLPGGAEPHSSSPSLNWVGTHEISSGQLTEREANEASTGGAAKGLRTSWHPKVKQISALWDANDETLSQPQVKKERKRGDTGSDLTSGAAGSSSVLRPHLLPTLLALVSERCPLREQGGCSMSGSTSPSRSPRNTKFLSTHQL